MNTIPQPERAPGIYAGLSNEDYHADISAFSASMIKILGSGSLAHLHARICGHREEPTAAMRLGSAVHSHVLDNAKLVAIPDTIERRAGPEWKKFKAGCDAEGLTPLKPDEYAAAAGMKKALFCSRVRLDGGATVRLGDILAASQREVSVYARDAETDLLCRCRPDLLTPDDCNIIPDIKTCCAGVGRPEVFAKRVANLEYDIAAAHYLKVCRAAGIQKTQFLFIAVESEPPYVVSWHRLSSHTIARAESELARRMDMIAMAVKTGEWPGYGDQVNEVELPPWVKRCDAFEPAY